jgi:succinylglutamic semialdehyde dehydrogenase
VTFPRLERPGDYLGGRFVVPAREDGVIAIPSPADRAQVVASHPFAYAHVDAAVDAARTALPAWRRRSRVERADLLRRYRDRLRAHREDIALTVAAEVGKPLWEARTEADAMASKVDVTLDEGERHTPPLLLDDLPGEVRWRPHGVVAVIGPFNFPGHLPNGQVVPALLAGNTIVHKPSDKAPSTAVWMARAFDEAGLPPGVCNVVQGLAETGRRLTVHEGVDGILFTGSAEVGRRILRDNAERPGRLIALELGGKNAAIALDDCDVERTARALAFAAFVTAGQRCTSTSRLVVTRGIADALLARLATIAHALRIGYPLDDDIFLGPVIDEYARARLEAAQRIARDAGFEPMVAGGAVRVPGREGHYVRPAIHRARDLDAAAPGYRDDELFGPDLAVYVARDLDEALAVAGDTRFGLIASVFTGSRERFERAADGLRVGVVHWNRPSTGASARLPFGGVGDSGNHRPAGVMMGASCAFPVSVLLSADGASDLPTWPGMRV